MHYHITRQSLLSTFAIAALIVAVAIAIAALAIRPANAAATTQASDAKPIPLRDQIGSRVTIQFRRDALGAAAPNGIPPTTNSMNGANSSISGTLLSIDDDRIVLERTPVLTPARLDGDTVIPARYGPTSDLYINRDTILIIQANRSNN